jgi:hypothetical protein
VFQVAVSSAAESVLGRSPSDTAHVEVVGELVTEFQKVEGQPHARHSPSATTTIEDGATIGMI